MEGDSTVPTKSRTKAIVIPVALTEDDSKAVDFAVDSLYRTGDSIHLVHVLRTREPGNEIYHGPVGTSVDIHDPLERRLEEQEIARAQQGVRDRYTNNMTEKSIEHSLHLFVHATNAEGHDIFQTVNSVCSKVDAEILVMSAVHKGFLDSISGKSVHAYALEQATAPVLVIV